MAWTKTDIVNQALLRLGEKTIGHLDDEAEPAPTMKRLLEAASREVQAAFPWQELVRREAFDEDPDGSEDGLHRYALPAETLRVLGVNPSALHEVQWRLERNFVVTGETSPATVEYVRHGENPGTWSIHLARAVWSTLAAAAALALTQNAGIEERMRAEAAQAMAEGRRLQSMDNAAHSYLPRGFGWRRARG